MGENKKLEILYVIEVIRLKQIVMPIKCFSISFRVTTKPMVDTYQRRGSKYIPTEYHQLPRKITREEE